MITYKNWEIQQNNANRYNVICVGADGIRRSIHEAETVSAAKRWIDDDDEYSVDADGYDYFGQKV
jgi:hypothetical protein